MLAALGVGAGILLIGGCNKTDQQPLTTNSYSKEEISLLQKRIEILENRLNKNLKNPSEETLSKATGAIKSITFRIGTKDDRLRIYWEGGRTSDLPCTKEQSIWACG